MENAPRLSTHDSAEAAFLIPKCQSAKIPFYRAIQYGGGSNEAALWFINQGRKYVEAPRWAALGIIVIMVVFAYNVMGTAIAARKTTGIIAVLMIDLIPLILLYLIAFPAIRPRTSSGGGGSFISGSGPHSGSRPPKPAASSSHPTLRWRKEDSNSRSRSKGTAGGASSCRLLRR